MKNEILRESATLEPSAIKRRAEKVRVHVAASRLGLSSRMVRHLIQNGKLPATRSGLRAWEIRGDEIDRYAANRWFA